MRIPLGTRSSNNFERNQRSGYGNLPMCTALRLAQKNFTIPATRTWYENPCITAAELPELDEVRPTARLGY